MNEIDLRRLDLNLLVTFDVLMSERSVTRAATRLARTQSAVSHALARLREQVGDPLMVKVGGRMTASPFAEQLIDDVRPILRSLQRVLVPSQPFEPATSTRVFRIAIADIAPSLFPRLMSRVRNQAPGATLDWVGEGPQTLLAVAEGQVDVAFVASALALPEGLTHREAGEIGWSTFMRGDHPAIAGWGAAAWARWPHAVVQIGNTLKSPVADAEQGGARKRRIAARVLNFSAVAPLLAQTDLLATLPNVVMHGALARYGLRALPPPFPVAPMPHRFVWSGRLHNDPAVRWIRELLAECFAEDLREAQAAVARQAPRKRGRGHPGERKPRPSGSRR
jgi:DNA-binding transcriptional LysR family regulator